MEFGTAIYSEGMKSTVKLLELSALDEPATAVARTGVSAATFALTCLLGWLAVDHSGPLSTVTVEGMDICAIRSSAGGAIGAVAQLPKPVVWLIISTPPPAGFRPVRNAVGSPPPAKPSMLKT